MKWRDKHSNSNQRMTQATLALVAAVALLVSLSTGVDALERRFALRKDYSFNAITSQSDVTDRTLLGLSKDVHAYALYSPGQEDAQLIGLLERYAARSRHFTFSIENLARNPTLLTTISGDLKDAPVGNDSLIVHCAQTKRTRILTGADFVAQGYDMEHDAFYAAGLNYEKSLTEALIYVSSDKAPTLQVLSGHGELTQGDTADMEALLSQFNYSVQRVSLVRGDTLDPASPLFILSPQKDLTDAELQQLNTFARAGGATLITWDYDQQEELPNFEAYYRGFGFVRRPGTVVAQSEATDSYYNYPAILIPYMLSTEPTASLVDAKQTMVIMPGSVSWQIPQDAGRDLVVQTVLRSGSAFIHTAQGLEGDLVQQPGDEMGEFVLAALSDRAFEDGTRARAFVIGSSGQFTDSWMYSNTYSAELLLNVVDYLDPGQRIALPIAPKAAIRPPLSMPSPWFTALLLLLPPGAVLASALLVLLPRRRL